MHVARDAGETKLWLRPSVAVAYNDGLSARDLGAVVRLVEANRDAIEAAWNEFFG